MKGFLCSQEEFCALQCGLHTSLSSPHPPLSLSSPSPPHPPPLPLHLFQMAEEEEEERQRRIEENAPGSADRQKLFDSILVVQEDLLKQMRLKKVTHTES